MEKKINKEETGEFKFIIEKNLLILSQNEDWNKELNLVSWNDRKAKFDIRNWKNDYKRLTKGITLTSEELKTILINADNLLRIIEELEKEK